MLNYSSEASPDNVFLGYTVFSEEAAQVSGWDCMADIRLVGIVELRGLCEALEVEVEVTGFREIRLGVLLGGWG